MRYRERLLGVLLVAVLGLGAGCRSEATGPGSAPGRPSLRVVFVTHGQATDPFWSVVQNGARAAGDEVGADVEYQSPETFDMVAMAQLIDAAVASKPDGLVVSLPDADALAPSVRAAVAAGIPVVSINSGYEASKALGTLAHVGLTEYDAGFRGGERLVAAGVKQALCVNGEVGNAALDQRCQGLTDALAKSGGSARVLAVELGDPTETQQRIVAALTADPSVGGLLSLGPATAIPAVQALRELGRGEAGRAGQVQLGTFDLTPEILQAVEAGDLLFAIDQQQYLQGYLPVVFLALYARNANVPGADLLPTGPAFVTRENVARLAELTRQGTR